MDKNTMRGFFLCLLLFALVSTSALAHPGRTDGNGGHTNHSTGAYHYHHGYDDHQHYDMDGDGKLDCPYKFERNSDSTAKSYAERDNKDRVKKQERNSSPSAKQVIGIILVAIIFAPIMLIAPVSIIAIICRDIFDFIHKLKKKLKQRR